MSRIRIMHVVHSLGTGGTEEGVRKLLTGLDPGSFEQIVCTIATCPELEPRSGARVISLGRSNDESGLLVGKFARIFRRERPHIVHSRNWGAIEAVPAGRLAGIGGVIHSEHGLEAQNLRRPPWRRKAFRRICFGWADCVFTVSEGLREYYVRQLGVPAARLRVISNGVDAGRFRPEPGARSALRQKLNISPETLFIGTVGRLDPVKDHRTLFEAAALALRQGVDLRLAVVGDGPDRAMLKDDIHTRGPLAERTMFLGESADIPILLNAFDVFVLSSLAEGMSNALLEAMAAGVTPVVTRVGGNPELVADGASGLLFEARDAGALAAHLESLASDPKRRLEMGVNARRKVRESFSLDRMLSDYSRLYEEVANRKKAYSALLGGVPAARTLSD